MEFRLLDFELCSIFLKNFICSQFNDCSTGFLKGSPKYGAVPKVLMAVGLGYILGKFSYKSNCEEKIMALPNSELAQIIRQRKGRPLWPRLVTTRVELIVPRYFGSTEYY